MSYVFTWILGLPWTNLGNQATRWQISRRVLHHFKNKAYSVTDNDPANIIWSYLSTSSWSWCDRSGLIQNHPIFEDHSPLEYQHLVKCHQSSPSASCRSTILSIRMLICAVIHPPLGSLSTKCHFIPFCIVIYHQFVDMFRWCCSCIVCWWSLYAWIQDMWWFIA